MVQLGADHVPVEGVALTKVYPEGNSSLTDTPVAALGPLLVAVMVKVTLLPTLGVALLTVFVTARSAAAVGTGVDVLLLLPGLGSVWFPLMVAVFAYVPLDFTVATIVMVAEAPLARLPMVQFGAAHVPEEGVALTKV